MKTKIKWLLLAGFLVLAAVALKGYRVTPDLVSPEKRQKILDELVSASPWIGGLKPDHSGNTLAYLLETDVGRRVVLVDLETLTKHQVTTTNEVVNIFGWSSDDRYLAYNQIVPKPVDLRKDAAKARDFGITIYDRKNDSFRRLTQEENVADVKFFWLTNGSFLWSNRRITTNGAKFAGWTLGTLQEPNGEKVSDFIPELSVMTDSMGVFGDNDLFTLELKPLRKTPTGWDEESKTARKISDFKTNDFTGLKWVNYSVETSNFIFCSRPNSSNWRYLYQYDPTLQKLTQLSHEDTYNGQWLLGGEGFAYVINTNDSFHLAVQTATKTGNTNLFTQGNLEFYKSTPKGDKVYAAASLGYEPQGIWEYTVTNQMLRKIVEGNSKPFEVSQVVQPRAVSLKSFDGVMTPCIFFAPVGLTNLGVAIRHTLAEKFRPNVKYPAIIYVPPGSSQFQRRFDRQAQIFANLGFHYAVINYRGCDGYGAEYKNLANSRDAARDVLNLHETLAADPSVDPKNIFLTTSSAGMAVVSELLAMRPELWAGVVLDKPGSGPDVSRLDPNKLPPMLMVMGGLDQGFDSMNAFVSWAKTNQVDISSLIFTNGVHGVFNLAERRETLRRMSDFFIERLR